MFEQSRRLLPPISMLHSFAAAARHESFSRAAREVGLTQSAISRQVAALENWVGQPLFARAGRRVTLNDAGRAYADAIEISLGGIRQATRRTIEGPRERVVELATLPSFGMRWLAPRLPRLTARYPDLIVNFTARSDEFNFGDEPFDAAIHFGKPDWPGASHDLLFHERAIPVLAPSLAGKISRADDFAHVPLLVQSARPDAWRHWFALAGVDAPPPKPSASFGQFLMLAQAALVGAGAALIPDFLIEPELAAGAFVSPVVLPLPSEHAYYLVYPERRLEGSGLVDLRSWMLSESSEFAGQKFA